MRRTLIASLAALAAPALCGATMIIDEDFESYADTAALGGVWSLGDGTLDTGIGNPGNSLAHPGTAGSFTGGNTNSFGFAEFSPTATDKLLFEVDIYDDGSIENNRTTAGLRRASGANLIEMGMYNNPAHYAYRVILFGSPAPTASGWVAFDNLVDDAGAPIDNQAFEGWHTFSAIVSDTAIEFSLDLNGDGNINATATEPITLNAAGGFDIVRLGGPSDLSSAGGGVNFDNVKLSVVPEPTAAALLLAGVAGVAARSRR